MTLVASLLALLVLAVPMGAHALPSGADHSDWVAGFRHPLLGWDHLLAMLALGVWAAQQRARSRLVIPLAFGAALLGGGALGAQTGALALTELAIGGSVLALGLFAGARVQLAPLVAAAVAASFGLAHGIAHGAEQPSAASALAFGAGMLAASLALHGIGWLAWRIVGPALAATVAASSASAQEAAPSATPRKLDVEEIVVTGRAQSLVGVAESASQGTVGAEQLDLRPTLRVGEVLETVPGLIVTQHAGGGKANQYFLRGFNLDHGTDFATSVDGVPVNLRSHGHGQGWTDLNLVIPELIARVNYRKGVYYADVGDFSSAGAADLQLVDSLEHTLVQVEGGRFGHARAVVTTGAELAGGDFVAGFEYAHNEGPWKRGDDFDKGVGMLRYGRGDEDAGWSVTALGYHGAWDSSDQIAVSAKPLVGRFGALDDSTGGDSQRYQLSAEIHRAGDDTSTRVMAYAFYYDLDLFSNFTYFANDAALGDQFEQTDERWTFGASARHSRLAQLGRFEAKLSGGVEIRSDQIDNGLFNTSRRQRVAKAGGLPAIVRSDDIAETSVSGFAEGELHWSDTFRSVLGVRADWFHCDVRDRLGLNSGERSDAIVSPKLTLIAGPWDGTELYAQAGLGYHSNDARGVNTRIDPLTLVGVKRADPLVRTAGAEVGVRTAFLPGLHSTVSAWWLDLDSELVFVGDAGTTEAGRPSRRYGLELANYWNATDWLTLDADVSWSRTRFRDDAPEGNHVPGSIETVVAAGATIEDWRGFFASVRLRYFGPRPLIEDDSARSDATLLVSAQAGYRWNERWTLTLDAFNLLDREDSDIDYFYESRISPTAPLSEERHFHRVEPISARLTLSAQF
ncbi:MAG: TonB-dependent receptor [Deltaproteobacteria bacterium]|nr:TonB-dependent receptor [Deltaproteobacteria bacterium]